MENLDKILQHANRNSGNWLPQVKSCPNRVNPCGNPRCADEALRARSIRQSSPYGSIQAEKNARKIASSCNSRGIYCPLTALGIDNLEVLDILIR